jgi:2-(1,2-epoxy-1,2-dihydrophenyl)acetyl-CoA isomerase
MADEKEPELIYTVAEGVATLRFNRPTRLNAITYQMFRDVARLVEEAGDDPKIRVIVITGTGRAFSSGADLGPAQSGGANVTVPSTPLGMTDRIRVYHRCLHSIMNTPKPVVAVLNGLAYGATLNIALACDFVLAHEDAVLCQVFTKRALVPDLGGMYTLPRLVGIRKAKELIYFAKEVKAPEAAAMGMINLAVPGDQLDAVAKEWITKLATGPTQSYGLLKLAMNKGLDLDAASALHYEALAQGLVLSSKDFQEGVMAFMQKREPAFKGQ